jgi:hypothetical protein
MYSTLNLVILYDASRNVYTVFDHNLTPEQAKTAVAKHRGKPLLALSVNQLTQHSATDFETCRDCRRDVARASGLDPQPKFVRRNKI